MGCLPISVPTQPGRLLIVILLWLWVCPLWARPLADEVHLAFRHVLPDQVATIGYINAMAQDSQGFMWFGGASGLARYDGYNLKIYHREEGRPGSLSNNYINDLLLASDGSLWVATRSGLDRYDARSDRFEHFQLVEGDPRGAAGSDITSMAEDAQGNFWVSSRAGLAYFYPVSGQFDYHPEALPTSEGSSIIWRVVLDHQGTLWLGYQVHGVGHYDPVARQLRHYPAAAPGTQAVNPPEAERYFPGPSFADVRELYVDRHNTLWVGTYGGGLNRYRRDQDDFERLVHDTTEKGAIVWAIREDHQGNLWVGDGSAVYQRPRDSDRFYRFTHQENLPTSLGNYVVNRLFVDRLGDIWVGFFPAGVDRVDRQASVFRNYSHSAADPNSVADGGVLSAFEDPKGNLWVGAGYGLSYYDRQQGLFTLYRHDPANPNSLSGNTVLSVVQDSRNQLWLGVWSGGLNRLDLATGRFHHYLPSAENPTAIRGREPWSVIEDSRGDIWVATELGLNQYQRRSDSFRYYLPSPEQMDGDGTLYARVVYEDKRGNIWLGSIRGLFLLDREKGTFTRYAHNPQDPTSLSANFVFALYEDDQGNFWVGTDGGGLNLMDRDKGTFIAYTSQHGLADNVVAGIVADRQDNLWLGTQRGLSRFDRRTGRFTNYDKRHGLNDNLFNRNTPVNTRTGDLFFGNSRGFTLFNPAELHLNTQVPQVVITELQIFNQPVAVGAEDSPLRQTIGYTDQLTLSHRDSVFSLEFAALSYQLPDNNQYAYRLQGFDANWHRVGNKRSATYTNLDPGLYVFEVKAANSDGLWNETPTRLQIRVLPPWWKTWWAYCVYVLAIALILYWFNHVQRLKLFNEGLRQSQRELEEAYRKLEAASLSDPLTGLKNRRFLSQFIAADVAMAERAYQNWLADRATGVEGPAPTDADLIFMLLDMDHFKSVNDNHGHGAGDKVLEQLSRLLETAVRESDYLVRWGGEEFLIVVRFANRTEAPEMAERIRQAVANYEFKPGDGQVLRRSCSMGFACYPFYPEAPTALRWEQVVDTADRALYAAKKSGRNRVVGLMAGNRPAQTFSPSMREDIGELINAGTLQVSGAEAGAPLVW